MPVKKHSFVYHSLIGLMDINHIGFKDSVLGGPVPQVEVLNVRAPDVQSESFASEGDTRSWVFPPNCMPRCQDWVVLPRHVSAFLTCFNVVYSHLPNV